MCLSLKPFEFRFEFSEKSAFYWELTVSFKTLLSNFQYNSQLFIDQFSLNLKAQNSMVNLFTAKRFKITKDNSLN